MLHRFLQSLLMNLNRTRLECKEEVETLVYVGPTNLNRTRLECKVSSRIHIDLSLHNLNRTRLECKEIYSQTFKIGHTIWIEPDWNVKVNGISRISSSSGIWIEPDWNVKSFWWVLNCEARKIWIEPDWNVKCILLFLKPHWDSFE